MKKLTKTAATLDILCHILAVALSIASVCLIVCFCIVMAGFLFHLPPHMVGSGYEEVELGIVTFTVANAYIPDHHTLWTQAAIEMVLTFLCLIPANLIVRSIQAILAPMKNGEPFHNTVSVQLGKIAKYVCALGIFMNLEKIISNILLVKAYDLNLLLLSEKVPHAEFHFDFDLNFLLVSGILLLLSYVFRYGEELQQLSDETL